MPSFTIMASTAVVRIPNPSKHVTITNVLQVIISIFAAYIYLFGIPQEYKRAMEEKALETMGENKASCKNNSNPPSTVSLRSFHDFSLRFILQNPALLPRP